MNSHKSINSMGVFPDYLKKARVTPLSKEGDKCNLSNYKPISFLPVFSKVFEKVAYTQLYNWKITLSCIGNNMAFVLRSVLTTQAILHFLQCLYKQ